MKQMHTQFFLWLSLKEEVHKFKSLLNSLGFPPPPHLYLAFSQILKVKTSKIFKCLNGNSQKVGSTYLGFVIQKCQNYFT